MNSKITATVIVVLIIVIGVFLVFNYQSYNNSVLTPVSDNMQVQNVPAVVVSDSLTKEVRDQKNNYGFFYPDNMSVVQGITSPTLEVKYLRVSSGDSRADIQFTVAKKQTSLKTFFDLSVGNNLKASKTPNTVTDVSVAGIPARKAVFTNGNLETTSVYFVKDQVGFSFSASKDLQGGFDMIVPMSRVLESFRFLK